jgi:hypothetical protein
MVFQDSPIKIIEIEKAKVDAIKTILNDVLPKKVDPILNPFPMFKPIPLSNRIDQILLIGCAQNYLAELVMGIHVLHLLKENCLRTRKRKRIFLSNENKTIF